MNLLPLILLCDVGFGFCSPSSVKGAVACATLRSPFPQWSALPRQMTMPDPFLPLGLTTTSNAGNESLAAFQDAVASGKAAGRIQTPDEWYACRQPEILRLLQEYQFGYYPDHSKETVSATRFGNNISIAVTAGGKTGRFVASLQLPSAASKATPVPVVINIGGMDKTPYIAAGIAIVDFDYTAVAADSNAKMGAFWDIYSGRDIGNSSCDNGLRSMSAISNHLLLTTQFFCRRTYSLGLGFPPRARRPQPHRPRNRLNSRRCDRVFSPRQRCSCSWPL